jgi:hypothetical protein
MTTQEPVPAAPSRSCEECARRSITDRFAELRQILLEEDAEIVAPERTDRPNAFVDVLPD